MTYLDILDQKIVVFDGAMGTNLQKMDLQPHHFGGEKYHGCNDFLVLSYPQAVESIHRSFLEVGTDVIETDTFRSNRITLSEYGLQDRVFEINQKAALLARSLADEYSVNGHARFVAGSIGPTGKLPSMNDPELSNITFDELSDVFCEQASGLISGGVDLLLIETSQDILEVKAAIVGIQKAFIATSSTIPIQAQVTLDTTGKMLLGSDISTVLAILDGFPICAIGLNCSTGPDHMREPLKYLGEFSPYPVSCIPNAGLPLNINGQAVYPLEPDPFSDTILEYVELYGVNIVGGCCGTTPEHIGQLVRKLTRAKPKKRHIYTVPVLASSIRAVTMKQDPPPFLIGERLNSQGSRKFKELLLAEDFENCVSIAQDQVDNGAHGLDLCVALTERSDEAQMMKKIIKTVAPVANAPFIIDTTEPEVVEMALKTCAGKCLINSINLESGRQKADRILSLAKELNAAVIALTIDEQGMAKTATRKLEIAKRIYDIAVREHKLRPENLVFDALTFTLATGDHELNASAVETLEGIRKIKKEMPDVLTSLGVSNVSFGLKPAARAVLNSVMLFHATKAGLDMAIVNPAQIKPYADISETERALADDLILNKNADALQHLIEYFEQSQTSSSAKPESRLERLKFLTPEERLQERILHRIKEEIEEDLEEIINRDDSPSKNDKAVKILNNVLLPAMKTVGDKFGSGELILPFVLQSAEVMKKAVNHLEQYLDRNEGISKGTVVIATVYGDVHDIGKNLVKTILSNNGYSVIDLGKQVPVETVINGAIENDATAIGLSALLVSTSKQMPMIVNELHRRNLNFPVLVGGAAINRQFGRRIMYTDKKQFYEPGVYFCKDAFEGLSVMDTITDSDKASEFKTKIRIEAEKEVSQVELQYHDTPGIKRAIIPAAKMIPKPPSWGIRVVDQMPLEIIFNYLPKKDLFRLSWGAKSKRGDEWLKLQTEFEERLESMKRRAIKEKWLNPKGIYGYFPAQSDKNDLIIYDNQSINKNSPPVEILRFSFPRQPKGDFLCLADYFSSVSSGLMDVVAFQIVTVGAEATARFEALQQSGDYSEAYYSHGLAVQTAEASAEYLHRHIRKEIGLSPDQGKRYSWGYPAIPELSDHAKVFKLLPAETSLGMQLTSAFQLVPEQSTAAIIVHHPDARYFNIGETKIQRLTRE